MPRFRVNRWWTRILALSFALAITMSVVGGVVTRAEAGQNYVSEPTVPHDPGVGGSGDPDVPTGNLKHNRPVDRYSATTEGGAMTELSGSERAWIVRVRFALLGLRALYLRF